MKSFWPKKNAIEFSDKWWRRNILWKVDIAKGLGNQGQQKQQLRNLKEKQFQANAKRQEAVFSFKNDNIQEEMAEMAIADVEISACRKQEIEDFLAKAQKAKMTKANKKVNLTIVKKMPESVAEMHRFAVKFDKLQKDESLQRIRCH